MPATVDRSPDEARTPAKPLDAEAVKAAYRRWARIYDGAFGLVSGPARRRAIAALNALPDGRVLEVGVGTGLALPHYRRGLRVVGIDLSPEMLALARDKVERDRLDHVEALIEMDAEAMDLPDGAFDAAVAMFVASVVPNPRRMMAEIRRVVRPGGAILLVNHFLAPPGIRRGIERMMAPFSRALGWHPDFAIEAVLSPAERERASLTPCPPFGLFTLVGLTND
jgi:phosphatidylethanolamine/phosphatidyl-N-methylethanolamine N-methyltransferase